MALKAVQRNKTLPPRIRTKAMRNLDSKKIKTRTTGFGKSKNSIWGN